MELYKEIRRLRLDGMSQRQIAGTLHISRNTVKKYWDGNSVPWERKDYSREATDMTDDVVTFVRQCLAEDDLCRSKKQQHTAKRIYGRLVEECGFTGGETTVRRLVRQLREKSQKAFVPLAFPAGDAMQIDWGEATVYLGGVKTVVNLFCARLCYSDAPIVLAYRRQNEESFLDALVRVFQYFGGVPKRVIFDNAKVAVKDGFGAHAKKQAGYTALSAHYGFEAIFCNPASGNEKGLVEGLVGYIRRNVCVPIPKVDSMAELEQMLEAKCKQYLGHQVRGKVAPVGELLRQDQEHLYPLPGYPFDPCKRTSGRVDRYSTVRFDTNSYSVPVCYCGKEVSVKAGPEAVSVYLGGACIAQHQRCFEKNQSVYTLAHYLPLLEAKGRAIFYAKPVQDTFPAYFLNWLQTQDLTPKELVQILRRCQEESCDAIMAEAPQHAVPPAIEDTVLVQAVDLQAYDAFLRGKAGVSV
jgi:transposase